MTHVLIVGMTESGKTTLAKQLAHSYRRSGIKTIVLDPLCDPGWNADYQTSNPAEFQQMVRASRQCAVFIDESGEMIGRYNDEMFWLATRARHYGHNCHFIVQRCSQLSPTVRDQCGLLFIFNISQLDSKTLSNEWNKPELRNASQLMKFECFQVKRFGEVKKINVKP